MKDGSKEFPKRVNGSTMNLEVEDSISKWPHIARVDDSKSKKQPLTDLKGLSNIKPLRQVDIRLSWMTLAMP